MPYWLDRFRVSDIFLSLFRVETESARRPVDAMVYSRQDGFDPFGGKISVVLLRDENRVRNQFFSWDDCLVWVQSVASAVLPVEPLELISCKFFSASPHNSLSVFRQSIVYLNMQFAIWFPRAS